MDIALAFDRVSFVPATSIKHAAMTFLAMAQGPGREADMTILQEEYLYLIAIRFRRQMRPDLVAMARHLLKLIGPLVKDERDRRTREANDRRAKREAIKRTKLSGQMSLQEMMADLQ